MKREAALDLARTIITQDRQATHGAPENTFRTIAEFWSTYMTSKTGYSVLLTEYDVCALMVLFKMARVSVNPMHDDNWLDTIGYGALGAEMKDTL